MDSEERSKNACDVGYKILPQVTNTKKIPKKESHISWASPSPQAELFPLVS
jgi:hypothetical protein